MTTASPSTRADLVHRYMARLQCVRPSLRRVRDQAVAPLGLSFAQAYPIVLIARHEGLRQRDLAERLEVEGPTLVRLLDQLGALGFIERRPDPEDLRARSLYLTPAGRRMADQVTPVLDALRLRLVAGVSDRDLEAAIRVFDAMLAATDQVGEEKKA